MRIKAFRSSRNVFEFGVSVYNQPGHIGFYIDFVFFYLMFEFNKRGEQ